MKKKYLYKENVIWFGEKQIIFSEKIVQIIEFEKCDKRQVFNETTYK